MHHSGKIEFLIVLCIVIFLCAASGCSGPGSGGAWNHSYKNPADTTTPPTGGPTDSPTGGPTAGPTRGYGSGVIPWNINLHYTHNVIYESYERHEVIDIKGTFNVLRGSLLTFKPQQGAYGIYEGVTDKSRLTTVKSTYYEKSGDDTVQSECTDLPQMVLPPINNYYVSPSIAIDQHCFNNNLKIHFGDIRCSATGNNQGATDNFDLDNPASTHREFSFDPQTNLYTIRCSGSKDDKNGQEDRTLEILISPADTPVTPTPQKTTPTETPVPLAPLVTDTPETLAPLIPANGK
jgi:hypothetical protein